MQSIQNRSKQVLGYTSRQTPGYQVKHPIKTEPSNAIDRESIKTDPRARIKRDSIQASNTNLREPMKTDPRVHIITGPR